MLLLQCMVCICNVTVTFQVFFVTMELSDVKKRELDKKD